ncbi:MAG: ABC transporter permease, partial [Clostridiales bacterium]|nr:ABC transporter permease [Candidatus Coliplasma equi]
MKKSFYPRMALSGIKKNGKTYLPYILSCILMVMMFYMIHTLSYSPALKSAKGGATLELILSLGKFVIAVFSLLFLLYTNSFLTKSRYKEFGLYSILGMDKKGISRIILWESLFVAAISLVYGILAGVLLSKLAELALLKAIRAESGFDFNFSTEALLYTLGLYIIVFAVLTVKSLITVRKSNPLALLRSSRTGEKPIKSNAVFAVIGIIILAAAYYLSVSIKTPLTAIPVFFAAVIMVIVATYMIFISGSVALCKLLKKKKNYYYDKKHFVSVSSMTYRMKRNGAGLASICILCTMVLVMISSTSSLYFGADESLSKRFIKDNSISVSFENLEDFNENNVNGIRNCYGSVFKEYKFKPENVYEYRYVEISGKTEGNNVNPVYNPNLSGIGDISDVVTVYFISANEYSRIGGSETLIKDNEVLIFTDDLNYKSDKISIANI